MLQNWWKSNREHCIQMECPSNPSSIARTDSGSVSTIRNFVFGDKNTDGWKFNSLSYYRRKRILGAETSDNKLKSPSFRNSRRNFFQNWSKSSRYSSTPNLNKGDQDKPNNGCVKHKLNERLCVRKIVEDFENSNLNYINSISPNSSPPTSNSLYNPIVSDISFDPDSCSDSKDVPLSPSISHRPSRDIEDRLHTMKKAISLCEIAEEDKDDLDIDLYTKASETSNHEIQDALFSNRIKDENFSLFNSSIINGNSPMNQIKTIIDWNPNLFINNSNDTNNNNNILKINHEDSKLIPQACDLSDIKVISTEIANKMNNYDIIINRETVNSCEAFVPFNDDAAAFVTNNNDQQVQRKISNHEITVVVQEPGRFLARWVPVEDLSSRDCDSTPETDGIAGSDIAPIEELVVENATDTAVSPNECKARRPAERRESGRFQSAARIIRSLRRSREGDGQKECPSVKGLEEDGHLNRSNFYYHSEGKGNKKRKKMIKEGNVVTNKERSRSFCDKPETNNYADLVVTYDESKLMADGKNVSPTVNPPKEIIESFAHICMPKPVADSSCTATSQNTMDITTPGSFPDNNLIFGPVETEPFTDGNAEENMNQNILEIEQLHKSNNNHKIPNTKHFQLHRDRERRSSRKLTKDSGYETSPYSEGDYANLDVPVAIPPDEGELIENSESAKLYILSESGTSENATKPLPVLNKIDRKSSKGDIGSYVGISSSSDSPDSAEDFLDSGVLDRHNTSPDISSSLKCNPSVESLTQFAEALVTTPAPPSSSTGLSLALSTPSLLPQYVCQAPSTSHTTEERPVPLNGVLQTSKSTPNLDDSEDGYRMVTKKLSMYSYLQGSSPPPGKRTGGGPRVSEKRFWDPSIGSDDTINQTDYAHHLRSSSYQLLHSRQHSTSSYPHNHSRQHSNASNYSDGDDISFRIDANNTASQFHPSQSHSSVDRSRCFSVESLGSETTGHGASWNISEPDLSLGSPILSSSFSQSQEYEKGKISPSSPAVTLTSKNASSSSSSTKLPSSPPPPPVRDASSLKYIRYGPGHEKFPSWPVPAGASNHVLPPNSQDSLSSNTSEYPDISGAFIPPPHGSHRSHSWTEQSEYPKEKCGGYARPSHKRQFSPSFQKQLITVMENCEKIHPDMFNSRTEDDILRNSSYSLIDNYLHHPTYYPLFDREGRGIEDKDYNIPSPPERDPGMGETHLSQMTVAQLEEHARRCDFAYGDYNMGEFPQITPLLDQLRQESYTWDGGSERDSGRGESESFTDSRYSNGRESVTTVVTNSSSASSSETLKWHGSLSDVSILSGHSRDAKNDLSVAHSARVQAPQKQNSESVLYYGRGKHFSAKNYDVRFSRENCQPRIFKDGKWGREVERNNEVNNLKKFPSYSYTQPLSQINESPLAESRESTPISKNPKSPVIDFSKPPSVAERINELERQSRSTAFSDVSNRIPRDRSEPRDLRTNTDEHQRESIANNESMCAGELRKKTSEKDLRVDSCLSRSDSKSTAKSSNTSAFRTPSILSPKHSRSFSRKDSNDSILSSDSSVHSYNESDRSVASSTSYTYLDPEKRCKVPDATLKNIQKQALLSFYERRTGKSLNNSTSPTSPSQKSDFLHSDWAGRSLRGDSKGAKSGKGMARLGRVPDSDKEQSPNRPIRRRSGSGRESIDDIISETSSYSSELPPLPAKPSQMNSPSTAPCRVEDTSENLSEEIDKEPSLSRVNHDLQSSTLSTSLHKEELSSPLREDDHPPYSLPAIVDDTPPKPPDRPPKKSTLRSMFHTFSEQDKDDVPIPSRSYYFRKPPAPDPPASPPESPKLTISKLPLSSEVASRSSTPELPPPPPPPSAEAVVLASDEPFPPPPVVVEAPLETTTTTSDISSKETNVDTTKTDEENTKISPISGAFCNGTYHKDSYMAQRKDWKTGYEGRYRRMHSPTAPDRNVVNGRNREHINNLNNNIKSSQSMSKPLSCKHPNTFHINGNLRSAVSTSSLLQRSSPTEKDIFNDNFNNCNINNNNVNNNHIHNTGWSPHSRQKSTTVNFTADELRAFKARKAAQESILQSSGDSRIENSSPISDSHHVPLRPLSRAFSMGEPLHIQRFDDDSETSLSIRESLSPCSIPSSPLSHDGPVIAQPATVTEETTPPSSPPKLASTTPLPPTSMSEKFNLNSPLQRTLSSPISVSSTVVLSVHSSSSSTASSSTHSSMTSLATSSLSASSSTLVSSSSSSSSLTLNISSVSNSSSATATNSGQLSTTGTCPSMTPLDLASLEDVVVDRANIVVLTYGRTPKPEVVDCDKLSSEFVQENSNVDNKLQALLAPGPEYKSMASYMDGVFTLEMRKDLLCTTHANHPDLRPAKDSDKGMPLKESPKLASFAVNGNAPRDHNDLASRSETRDAPLPVDSAYFTTSKAKAKLLSKIRISQEKHLESFYGDHLHLLKKKKKDTLIKSISRKLDILRREQSIIKDEMSQNFDLGVKVTAKVESRAKPSEVNKFKLHVEEIDKITSLLLGLSGRLARAENALLLIGENDIAEEKRILESKRDKLSEQLDEAKKLKENIDRRAVQISRILTQYLNPDEYADYDHFIKMKAKLIMDKREIEDKVTLGEEQLQALSSSLLVSS